MKKVVLKTRKTRGGDDLKDWRGSYFCLSHGMRVGFKKKEYISLVKRMKE